MYTLKTTYKKLLADTITPVSVYLKIRDKYPNSLLLESSDYHANDNSFSYVCCNPIASIKIKNGQIEERYPDGNRKIRPITSEINIADAIQNFSSLFKTDASSFKFINNGLTKYFC